MDYNELFFYQNYILLIMIAGGIGLLLSRQQHEKALVCRGAGAGLRRRHCVVLHPLPYAAGHGGGGGVSALGDRGLRRNEGYGDER